MPTNVESPASSVSHMNTDSKAYHKHADPHSLASVYSDHAGKSRLPAQLPDSPIVPTAERRGLLARFCVIPEHIDAHKYPKQLKRTILFVVAFAAVAGSVGTTILVPAAADLAQDLGTSELAAYVLMGVYFISFSWVPRWWLSFSERHGHRSVIVVSFVWFWASSIACALAQSIVSLVVLRFLAGASAMAVQACGACTVMDLYAEDERTLVLVLYSMCPLLGPFLAPLLGDAVVAAWGWRATMWLMAIVCGLDVFVIIFFLPETLRRNDLDKVRGGARDV